MRLLTRSDFDGLACAVLLTDIGIMDNWMFVHPKDVQDGKYPGDPNDIVANVPYIKGCGYWFDHHSSEDERLGMDLDYQGMSRKAKSAARVIWEYFGGNEKFGDKFDEMLHYVDKVDSGDLTAEEIENPTGWILMGFIMDPRTGLGRYRHFHMSNYQLMEKLIEYCRSLEITEILELPDVKERIDLYLERDQQFRDMLVKHSEMFANVLVLDLREQEEIFPGNRFTVYSMFPQCDVSIQIMWGKQKQNTVFSVGHSIIKRTCKVDVGSTLLQYGGGGHKQVGTCQVPHEQSDAVLGELVAKFMNK
ncbi:exopolyphosphatase [Desulfovibrio gilichinskyi]|uniref:NanoRNase/pAp phosphatase, hydrolyzes c-di-AMP and oligoRNAs n=1 Tax=Desulfovibrio gilichinskyi TaxID=1519643 RepID=A0A1X7CF60_9BACT|nr:exopolyphosphatase [Desulfovibrio gilichinskyi]SME95502.1 nanoRNase/pAp phosphatase, hydrolyzes c-di-AMP and oligoRNAs [Desulfovibrio gilichinskyi]